MKNRIKKIFVIFFLPITLFNYFLSLTIQAKKEEVIINKRSNFERENPEIPHIEYHIGMGWDYLVSGISTTASTISSFTEDTFNRNKY